MIPAEIKKKENIAEYIIYMYQTEDLIATYNFNLDEIFEYVISHMSKEPQTLKSLLLWYAEIIENMQLEGLPADSRRLSSTQAYVDKLTGLHDKLLKDNESYIEIFNQAKEGIEAQIEFSGGKITNPIQICINAIYGRLIINLNGKKLSADQENMIEQFASVLKFLTNEYHRSN